MVEHLAASPDSVCCEGQPRLLCPAVSTWGNARRGGPSISCFSEPTNQQPLVLGRAERLGNDIGLSSNATSPVISKLVCLPGPQFPRLESEDMKYVKVSVFGLLRRSSKRAWCSAGRGRGPPKVVAATVVLKDFIYVLLQRREEREKERERNIDRFPLAHPQPGTWPTSQPVP